MALIILAIAVGLAVGLAGGGRIGHFFDQPFRWWALAVAGVAFQLAGSVPFTFVGLAMLLVFALRNLSVTGMGVLAIGLGINAAVIGLNNGTPVRPSVVTAVGLASAGHEKTADLGSQRHLDADAPLGVLGDIIPIRQLKAVVSFGDLIIAVGLADILAHLLLRRQVAGDHVSSREAPIGGDGGIDDDSSWDEATLRRLSTEDNFNHRDGIVGVNGKKSDKSGEPERYRITI